MANEPASDSSDSPPVATPASSVDGDEQISTPERLDIEDRTEFNNGSGDDSDGEQNRSLSVFSKVTNLKRSLSSSSIEFAVVDRSSEANTDSPYSGNLSSLP